MITPYSNIISVTTLEVLLLDTYSGAAAAYSLRRLSGSYSGSAIRVRRASDNTEQDIGFVNNELDTSTLTSFCSGTNGFVTTWYDQSGNGRDATQTTAANQPQIVSSGSVIEVNAKSAITFSRKSAPGLFFTGINLDNFTILWVARNSDLTINNIILGSIVGNQYSGDEVDNNGSPMLIIGSTRIITNSNSNTTTQSGRTTQHLSYLNRRNSIEAVGQFNNSNNSYNNSVSSITFTPDGICTYQQGYNFAGDIQELIIYSSDMSSDRTGISTNINAQYNIYWDGSQTSLLDTYSGSAAAYSLRALSSAYTGPLVRVRRASDNAEQDIYAKYDGTLNVDALESFCSGTNGFVKTWYDQSGNGRDATQTTAANQPQIVSSGSVITEGGKPSIRFIAANPSYLRNTSSFSYQTTFTLTRFITRSDFAYLISAESAIQKGLTDLNGTGYRIFANAVLYANINPSLTNQDLIYGLFNGVNSQISVDNSNIVTGDTGTSSATGIIIGVARNINIGSEFDGTMQEIITYDSNQSTNRTAIQSNINSFYSIY